MRRSFQGKKSLLKSRWVRILVPISLLAVLFGNKGFLKLVSNWLELRSLSRVERSLRDEQARFAKRLDAIRAGDIPLERMARRDLGYIKPGEIEYRFPPPSKTEN